MKELKWVLMYKYFYYLKAEHMRNNQTRYFDYMSLYVPQGLAIANWLEDKFKEEGAR